MRTGAVKRWHVACAPRIDLVSWKSGMTFQSSDSLSLLVNGVLFPSGNPSHHTGYCSRGPSDLERYVSATGAETSLHRWEHDLLGFGSQPVACMDTRRALEEPLYSFSIFFFQT